MPRIEQMFAFIMNIKPFVVRLRDTFIVGLSFSWTIGEMRLGIDLGLIEIGVSITDKAEKARDNFIEAVQEANKPGWKPPSALPRPGRSGEVKGEGHASMAKDLPNPEKGYK